MLQGFGRRVVIEKAGRSRVISASFLHQLTVKDRDLTAPPAGPARYDAYIVKATATGVWTGFADAVAVWEVDGWVFIRPWAGLELWVVDDVEVVRWDGSAWVSLPSVVQREVSALDINNDAAENQFLGYTVKAGRLKEDRELRVRMAGDLLNNYTAGVTFTLRVKFGGSLIFEDISPAIAQTVYRHPWLFDFTLANLAYNSQILYGRLTLGETDALGPTVGIGNLNQMVPHTDNMQKGELTIDTAAADRDFVVTIQLSNANSNYSFRRFHSIVEVR
jgi:hypothetical protein